MQYVGWTSIHNFPKWQIMLAKVIILFTISVGREGVNIDYYNSLLLLSLFMVEGGLRGYSAKFNAPPTCFIWVKVDWESPSWRTTNKTNKTDFLNPIQEYIDKNTFCLFGNIDFS